MKLLQPLRERDFAAGLRRDEDRHPLLGEDYAGAGASAGSGDGTPAIS